MARRTVTLIALGLALSAGGCGGSGSHAAATKTFSPTTAATASANTVDGAIRAIQQAVHDRDVDRMCNLLLPATAVHAQGSPHAIQAAVAAAVRDCEAGFGKRGEFATYAPLLGATVTGTSVRGRLASVQLTTNRRAVSLRFLQLAGHWRLLVPGD